MNKITKQIWKQEPVFLVNNQKLDHNIHKEVQVRFPDGMETTADLFWREQRVPYHIHWMPFIKVFYHGIIVYLDFDDEKVRDNLLIHVK